MGQMSTTPQLEAVDWAVIRERQIEELETFRAYLQQKGFQPITTGPIAKVHGKHLKLDISRVFTKGTFCMDVFYSFSRKLDDKPDDKITIRITTDKFSTRLKWEGKVLGAWKALHRGNSFMDLVKFISNREERRQ